MQQKDGVKEYVKGNVKTKKTEPIFSKEKIAAAMAPFMLPDAPQSAVNFTQADFDFENKTATVEMQGKWYKINLKITRLTRRLPLKACKEDLDVEIIIAGTGIKPPGCHPTKNGL